MDEQRKCLVCGAPVTADWFERAMSLCDVHHAERDQVIATITSAEKAALEAIGTIRIAAQKHHDYAHHIGTGALTHIATMSAYESKFLWQKATERIEAKQKQPGQVAPVDDIPF